jgi:ankyrin repeat protein
MLLEWLLFLTAAYCNPTLPDNNDIRDEIQMSSLGESRWSIVARSEFADLPETDPDCFFGSLATSEQPRTKPALSFFFSLYGRDWMRDKIRTPCVNQFDGRLSPFDLAIQHDQAVFVKYALDFGCVSDEEMEKIHHASLQSIQMKTLVVLARDLYWRLIHAENSVLGWVQEQMQYPLFTANMRFEDGKTSLRLAIERGDLALVEEVIKAGALVDCLVGNDWPIFDTIALGNHRMVKVMLEAGASVEGDPTMQRPSALLEAVRKKDTDTVRVLLDAGANVNRRDVIAPHASALHLAANMGDKEMCKWLVSYGANILAEDDFLNLPKDWSISRGHCDLTRWFLRQETRVYANKAYRQVGRLFGTFFRSNNKD